MIKTNKQITVFSGVVIKDNKVLMVLRNEQECLEAHMKWEFPGGKVDFGETPEHSVVREILEETGVLTKIIKMIPTVQTNYWEYEWGTQQTLCFTYQCEYISEKPAEKDHHVEKIEWIDIGTIIDMSTLPGTNEVIELLNL